MKKLNDEFNGELDLAIEMFKENTIVNSLTN